MAKDKQPADDGAAQDADATPAEAVTAESSPSPATPAPATPKDKGKDKGPSCPTCGAPMERYVGPNPHKQGTWRCPVHLVRHRLDG